MNQVLQANRATGNRLAQMRSSGAEGVLEGVSIEHRAFNPGHRTADRGLGDDRGIVVIRADDGREYRWTLHDSARIDDEFGGLGAEATGQAVTIRAGEGGTYVLRAHSPSATVGEILLSVPYLVHVSHSHEDMAAALNRLGIAETDHEQRWGAVIRTAKRVAAHVLRPVNVRLNWSGTVVEDVLPEVEDPAAPSLLARKTAPTEVLRAVGVLVGPEEDLLDQAQQQVLAGLRPGPDADHDRAWQTLLSRQVRGAGGTRFSARVGSRLGGGSDEIDQILNELVGEADRWAEFSGRVLGIGVGRAVLRSLGLTPAETGRDENVLPCEIIEREPANHIHSLLGLHRPSGAQIPDLEGALNGIAADASADQRRSAMENHWGDLVDLYVTQWGTSQAETTEYDVLAGLVSTHHLENAQILAPLPGPYSRRTLMPGSVDATVDGAGVVQSAARYGSEGDDLDGRGTAVADLQTDLKRLDIVYGLEPEGKYGYRRLWFRGRALDPAIFDGELGEKHPHEADPSQPKYGPTMSRLVQRGYTGLAVREFQIAGRYPNDVVEQLTATEPYADRLAIALTDDDRADDGTEGTPIDGPNGEVEPIDGIEIQRWIFARRRLPVVIEARERINAGTAWTVANSRLIANPRAHNLIGPNDVNDDDPRMFVVDLSGMPQVLDKDAAQVRRVLGDYGGVTGYGGPHASGSHTMVDIELSSMFGDESPVFTVPAAGQPDEGQDLLPPNSTDTPTDVREWFTIAWSVLDAVTRTETGGSWDGMNAWDSGVWSHPLFHYTLRTGKGGPGKMPEVVGWLQNPANTIPETNDRRDEVHELMQKAYQRAFGRYGVGAGPSGATDRTGYLHIPGLRRVSGGSASNPWTVDMANDNWHTATDAQKDRMEIFYDSYVQWFRSWQWAARFTRNLRFDPTVHGLLVAHGIDWICHAMERTEGGRAVETRFTTARAVAAYIRAYVNLPGACAAAFRAIPDQQWNQDQRLATDAFIRAIPDADLIVSTREAADAVTDGHLDFPSPDNLRKARDWVLRALV